MTTRSACLDILIADRHGIGTESALVRRHGGGHAQPRVGVDVGAADETFHQLVGDVIILGQQLPGDIERHGIRAMLGDDLIEAAGDLIQRFIP